MSAQVEQVTISKQWLGTGDAATYRTVDLMSELTRQSAQDWNVRHTASQIVKDCPHKDERCEILSVFNWVRDHTRFLKDPYGTEMLHRPVELLQFIQAEGQTQGDCDDLAALTASLLMSVGYPVGFRVISTRPDGRFSHVFSIVFAKGQWWPLDATDRLHPAGWQVNPQYVSKQFDRMVKP